MGMKEKLCRAFARFYYPKRIRARAVSVGRDLDVGGKSYVTPGTTLGDKEQST